ncbi:speckle-type POZ protein-like B [Trichonephila inaurata madagascariensis]|uniref:Speckle-type POZ protein-like B n=1 Tax=Trichonephila inaurata madagascariensis TaxID=2747483 RepID=A0A8X6X1D7_9ARAC|nr:speckle-type POZ protein-like B [Trichonephila inaurata madagascariensis]
MLNLGEPKVTNVNPMNEFNSLKDLSTDLMHLFDEASSLFADVELKCGSFTIPAHKGILAARSPVFSAMFKNKMRESRERTVDITDIDFWVLRTMLVYIYTGNTDDITMSSVQDLLYAADKYQLTRLKNICSEYLKSNVTDQNVLYVLVLGDFFDQKLKDFAIKFICNKVAEFSILETTQEWKRLRKERAELAMEVLVSLVKARDKKLRHLMLFRVQPESIRQAYYFGFC